MMLKHLLLWLGVVALPAFCQNGQDNSLSALPQCAQTCLTSALESSVCTQTDLICQCTNKPFLKEAEACVMGSCSPKEALQTLNGTNTACGATVRDRSQEYNVLSITMGVITCIIVLIRIIYQVVASSAELGLDDWFIVITLCVGIPATIINSVGLIPNGLGKDVWAVPFDNLTAFVRWFYVMEILYFAQIALLKTSILFFYQRIFGHSGIKLFILGTLVFNALYGVIFVLLAIFQCQPISYYWTNWDGEHEGKCLNVNSIAWANAGISIAIDIWMLGLPLSQIKSLNLHWKKKVGVAMMFSVGAFVTIVSILRLQSLVDFAKSHNSTWEQYEVAKWSTIEINVGIMCACMPSLRLILVRFFPRILGSTRQYPSRSGGGQYVKSAQAGSRKLGSESVVRTANRDQRLSTMGVGRKGAVGILCTRDVTVDYHDETSLVRMRDLEQTSMKDGSSRTSY